MTSNIAIGSSKDFIENLYKSIRKYITEGGEYTGKIIAFLKKQWCYCIIRYEQNYLFS